MKQFITRRNIAAAILCLIALLLLARLADMTVIRPDAYRSRIEQAFEDAREVAS